MGILSSILGFCGFGIGTSIGIVIGYYMFIYFQPTDVKDPVVRPLIEQDSKTLQRLLPEIPQWVKNPDYDRVDWLNKLIENMWPYINTAICKTARNIAKPIIAELIPKYKIDSVEFETLTLGSLPPNFPGFKRSCAELISASPTYFGRVDYLGKTNPEPIKFVDIQEHVQIFSRLIKTVIFSF